MTIILVSGLLGTSCQDWLMEVPAGTQETDEYYVDGQSCGPVVVACYAPMQLQYRDGYYLDEWFIGDICSDDAFKGGQFVEEDANLLDMENFRVNADNDILLQFYRIQYVGIARCNRAIRDINEVEPDEYMDMSLKARYIAEAQCLRAFYYMRLVRVFGKIVQRMLRHRQRRRAVRIGPHGAIELEIARAQMLGIIASHLRKQDVPDTVHA